MTPPDMHGKICMITGASSGVGQATAIGLAGLGATLVLVSRDQHRGEATKKTIIAASGNSAVEVLLADLSSQRSIRALAAGFKQNHTGLHVLVNNAGGVSSRRTLTEDGLETTFAVNHLAYFLLTNLLLDVLRASAPARIVNVSSETQSSGTIRFDDLQGERDYSIMRAYSQSKLANVLFTYELARRLAGTGVTANCLHPGLVATRFGRKAGGLFGVAVRLSTPFSLSPEQGARTSVYLASSPEVEGVTGKYFVKGKEARSSRESYDEAIQRRLWRVSAELTGLAAAEGVAGAR